MSETTKTVQKLKKVQDN